MSTDSDHATAEKAAANKRIADEVDASAAAMADWPTGGYNTFFCGKEKFYSKIIGLQSTGKRSSIHGGPL